MFADIIYRHNGGMLELGNGFYFAFETVEKLRIMKKFARQNLDGNLAVEARIICTINGCHTAAPQFIFYFVSANGCEFHTSSITRQELSEKVKTDSKSSP